MKLLKACHFTVFPSHGQGLYILEKSLNLVGALEKSALEHTFEEQ